MKITLEIPENKAAAFINFIKSLDFIKISEETESYELSDIQKKILDERYSAHKQGNTKSFTFEEVVNEAKKLK
jgi:hypothetical protein